MRHSSGGTRYDAVLSGHEKLRVAAALQALLERSSEPWSAALAANAHLAKATFRLACLTRIAVCRHATFQLAIVAGFTRHAEPMNDEAIRRHGCSLWKVIISHRLACSKHWLLQYWQCAG